MREMTGRERFLCAAQRGVPDRVARDIWLEAGVSDILREHFGSSDLVSTLKQDVVGIGPDPTVLDTDFSGYFTRSGVTWDEWGRGRVWDRQNHYAEYLYPLERANTLGEIQAYPWPDLNLPYRFSWVGERVDDLHARGLAVRAELAETVFEIAWQVRSMERLFDDMAHAEDLATAVLDAITDRRVAEARAFTLSGVDAIFIGDDVAMQTGLMLSRKMWRKWFRPRLARVIATAREIKPDIPVQYHSDGKIDDLIPDLIDLGVTILNPIQPECVDHSWVKAAFGDRLAFCGGLGVQSVLPFGTPTEVRQHTREVIERLGANGGLIIGPSHVIERDTPLENILAMLEAIAKFGNYS